MKKLNFMGFMKYSTIDLFKNYWREYLVMVGIVTVVEGVIYGMYVKSLEKELKRALYFKR